MHIQSISQFWFGYPLSVLYNTFDCVCSSCYVWSLFLKIQTKYLHNLWFSPVIQVRKLGITEVHLLANNTGLVLNLSIRTCSPDIFQKATLTPQNESIHLFSYSSSFFSLSSHQKVTAQTFTPPLIFLL